MKTIKKRVNRLEQRHNGDTLPPLEVVIIDSKEQADHPERFRKVLDSEDISPSGMTTKTYHYESE